MSTTSRCNAAQATSTPSPTPSLVVMLNRRWYVSCPDQPSCLTTCAKKLLHHPIYSPSTTSCSLASWEPHGPRPTASFVQQAHLRADHLTFHTNRPSSRPCRTCSHSEDPPLTTDGFLYPSRIRDPKFCALLRHLPTYQGRAYSSSRVAVPVVLLRSLTSPARSLSQKPTSFGSRSSHLL